MLDDFGEVIEEDDTECDQTGEPCALRQVELLPENELAWELYWIARQPGAVPQLIFDLRTMRMTEDEAEELAEKITTIAAEWSKIEAEKAEEERRRQQNAGNHVR